MVQYGSTIYEIPKSPFLFLLSINWYWCHEERKGRIEKVTLIHDSQVVRPTSNLSSQFMKLLFYPLQSAFPALLSIFLVIVMWHNTVISFIWWYDFFRQKTGSCLTELRTIVHMLLAFTKGCWMQPYLCSLIYDLGFVTLPLFVFCAAPYNHNLTEPLSKHEACEWAD